MIHSFNRIADKPLALILENCTHKMTRRFGLLSREKRLTHLGTANRGTCSCNKNKNKNYK